MSLELHMTPSPTTQREHIEELTEALYDYTAAMWDTEVWDRQILEGTLTEAEMDWFTGWIQMEICDFEDLFFLAWEAHIQDLYRQIIVFTENYMQETITRMIFTHQSQLMEMIGTPMQIQKSRDIISNIVEYWSLPTGKRPF